MTAKRVLLVVELGADLAEADMWPDGDAPVDWGAQEVAEFIANECRTLMDVIRKWTDDVEGLVTVEDDLLHKAEIVYPGALIES